MSFGDSTIKIGNLKVTLLKYRLVGTETPFFSILERKISKNILLSANPGGTLVCY